MNVEIKYTGEYPNLCSGQLTVTVNGKEYVFPSYCMSSGGYIDGEYNVYEGPWEITDWPDNFPESLKSYVLNEVNDVVPWGCCGGCV